MKYLKFLFLPFFVLLLACDNDNADVDPLPPFDTDVILSPLMGYENFISAEPVLDKGRAVTKEIKFSASGIMDVHPNPDVCGMYYQAIVSGDGIGSHIGNFHVDHYYCSDGVDPVSPIIGIFTAANGDKIRTVIWLILEEGDESYVHYLITGGTGRFLDACGNFVLHGLVDTDNLVWALEGEGIITY